MYSKLNSRKKILRHSQTVNINSSSAILNMLRCRCSVSRRISSRLIRLGRRNRQRIERLELYHSLRDSVPSIAYRRVSKVTILNEASRHIANLEAQVLAKFQRLGMPKTLGDVQWPPMNACETPADILSIIADHLHSKSNLTA